MGNVTVRDADGRAYDVPEEQLASFAGGGLVRETPEDMAARVATEHRDREYGGPVGQFAAAGLGALGTVTGGLSDVALRGIGGGDTISNLAETNPISHGAGALAGAFVPTGLGGLASKAGGALRAGEGAGLGRALLGGVAGGAAEGALFGAGQGLSDAALSRDPLTLERIASSISSNALYGAALGGGSGLVGSAAQYGLNAVDRGLQRATSAVEEGAAARAAADSVPQDLASLDVKGLRAAGDAERDALAGQQLADRAAARSQAVDDTLAYRAAVKDANPWLAIDEGEQRAQLQTSNKGLRAALDDPKGLRENPSALLKPLRKEEQALEGALAKRDEIAARLDGVNAKISAGVSKDLASLADDATHVELTGKAAERYGSFADVKVKRGAPLSIARDDAQQFVDALNNGEVAGATRQSLDSMSGLLDQNRALQEQIKKSLAPLAPRADLTSERLTAVQNARDALAAPKPEGPTSVFAKAASGAVFGAVTGAAHAIPVIGQVPGLAHLVGAKAAEAVTGLVFGRLGKATEALAEKTRAVAKAFSTAGGAAEKYVPTVATKVLAGVRFASPPLPVRGQPTEQPKDLASLFKARTDEIKSQTVYDQTGTPVMRPEAREQMAQILKPIRAADPIAADRIETLAARRIEYLSSIIPRRPDFGTPQLGPDRWRPSDMEMRSFARSVHAVEDPSGVELRAVQGAVTPEDAAAYWAVYPERAQYFKEQLVQGLPSLEKPLDYARRLSLGIFARMPVDPSMSPRVLRVMQSQFTEEPGSEQGTQAPKPIPAFGSIKKSPDAPTASQQRAAQGALQ